ncbi:hypothetical protein GCM10010976_23920 [Bizionia arctica]|uniref:Uncharacterized protein n=1 Tax=Bizionia arctica TaxID=1495645 RepID=A0A917LR96_9FLAO|nr:hypothetical protein GCM10010976_23920 [Bizionia arctica]
MEIINISKMENKQYCRVRKVNEFLEKPLYDEGELENFIKLMDCIPALLNLIVGPQELVME